jgi:hypothetical protein
MHWLILGVIAIALLLMAAQYPKIAFGLLGALVIGFVILYRLSDGDLTPGKALIDPAAITLDHIRMEPGYAGSYRFSGRIANHAQDATLSEISVQTAMQDCIGEPPSCIVIGEAVTRITLNIPPRQARDFNTNVYLGSTGPKGTVRWTHDVVATQVQP